MGIHPGYRVTPSVIGLSPGYGASPIYRDNPVMAPYPCYWGTPRVCGLPPGSGGAPPRFWGTPSQPLRVWGTTGGPCPARGPPDGTSRCSPPPSEIPPPPLTMKSEAKLSSPLWSVSFMDCTRRMNLLRISSWLILPRRAGAPPAPAVRSFACSLVLRLEPPSAALPRLTSPCRPGSRLHTPLRAARPPPPSPLPPPDPPRAPPPQGHDEIPSSSCPPLPPYAGAAPAAPA